MPPLTGLNDFMFGFLQRCRTDGAANGPRSARGLICSALAAEQRSAIAHGATVGEKFTLN